KSASMLGVQYILVGAVEGANLTLSVRDAETGAVVDTLELKNRNVYRLKRSIATSLSKDLTGVITAAQAAAAAAEEAAAAAAEEEEEEAKEEAATDAEGEEEDGEEATDEEESTEEEEVEEEADDGPSRPSPPPRIVLAGGIEAMRRDFTYSEDR